jgi:FkbM family methyltransferase
MKFSLLVWHKLRLLGRLPGSYQLFYFLANLIYRNGSLVRVRMGPAAGFLWRHYHGYQPWMALGLYEPDTAELIYRSLSPGQVFYDIGGNAGYFTLIAAKAVGRNGRVIAFDPMPKHAATIHEQITINRLQDICCVRQCALAHIEGERPFLIPRRSANAHLAEVEAPHVLGGEVGETITVPLMTLDRVVSQEPWPNFIKMDIEGSEVKALQGAESLLSSPQAPVFLITAHSDALDQQVRSILQRHGYQFGAFRPMIHALPHHRQGERH